MITEMRTEELVALGARHRADYLVEQAGYTLGLAAAEGKALEELLPEGYLAEVREVVAALTSARQDRALEAAESKEATQAQHQAFKDAKVWRRKVVRRALRARRMGAAVPDRLVKIEQTASGPGLVGQVVEMVRLLEASAGTLHGAGTDALLAEGKALALALQDSDAEQETKRLGTLPDAVRRLYVQKGLLYVGLKVIHDAAQELHAGDQAAASRYNLGILYRSGKRKPAATPPTAPEA